MSFLAGSTALTICKLPSALPEGFLEKFAENSIGNVERVKDETLFGWAGWRHTQAPVDEANAICGGHLYLQFVTARRQIKGTALKDECRRQELAFMKANDTAICPSKERRRIKEEVKERMLAKTPVSVSAIDVAVSVTDKLLYIGATTPKQVFAVLELFYKTTGALSYPQNLTTLAQSAETLDGRDFLTWLWKFSDEGGKVNLLPGLCSEEIESMISGPLVFEDEDAKGALHSRVQDGCPELAAEAKAALLAGKKLKKAKLTIVRDKQIWSGTFDAKLCAFSGFTLPDGEEMEAHARFAERIELLRTLYDFLEEYAMCYNYELKKAGPEELKKKLLAWAKDRPGK